MATRFFFYGTLCDPDLRNVVLGPGAAALSVEPARLPGHAVLTAAGEDYPILVPEAGRVAEGVLTGPFDAAMTERLRFFEGEGEYTLEPRRVETAGGMAEALVCWPTGHAEPGPPWDLAEWSSRAKPAFLAAAREYMAHFGRPLAEVEPFWPGMRLRGAARAAAEAERPGRALRAGFGRGDVEPLGTARPWLGHFSVEVHEIRHRRFGGGWSEPLRRAAFLSGDAVTVLPWDPVRDAVLLVEQWRAGPWARGDLHPWTLEPVAGRRDPGEPAEETARREALEEAGLRLGRVERIAAYYPSPGILSEFITSFLGEADLSAAGGLHGLASEAEDIRAVVVPFGEALAAIGTGEVANAPLVLSLLWLARERERLRADWALPASV